MVLSLEKKEEVFRSIRFYKARAAKLLERGILLRFKIKAMNDRNWLKLLERGNIIEICRSALVLRRRQKFIQEQIIFFYVEALETCFIKWKTVARSIKRPSNFAPHSFKHRTKFLGLFHTVFMLIRLSRFAESFRVLNIEWEIVAEWKREIFSGDFAQWF